MKNNFGNGNSASYTKADPDDFVSDLAGTANGPLLVSNLGTLNLSGGKKYKLLLTGVDVPLINEGEAMPLYYNGNVIPKYAKNSLNYSVVYRFNVAGFTGSQAVLQFNPQTNPAYLQDPDSGIYVACCVNGSIIRSAALLQSKYSGYNTELIVNDIPMGSVNIEIVVSGMSSMPITVILK